MEPIQNPHKALYAAQYWTLQERRDFAKRYPNTWAKICPHLPDDPRQRPLIDDDNLMTKRLQAEVDRLKIENAGLRELLEFSDGKVAKLEGIYQREETIAVHTLPAQMILKSFEGGNEISHAAMLSNRRDQPLVYIRQACQWYLRQRTGLSYPQIGSLLGGKDHSTVQHSCKKVRERREFYAPFIYEAEQWMDDRALLPDGYKKEIDARSF